MKSNSGLLSTNFHQVFVVQILPREIKTYKNTLQLKLNDADKNIQVCVVLSSPTRKMGRHFPVREKSGNFEQTVKVRGKLHQKLQKSGNFRQMLFIRS